MKQLLFLLLFPAFALAQYQGNANQKITLGEQTTADGLVWRGIRADTTSKIVPFSDTSAYIILDTVEKTLWLYKAGQIPKWQQVGGSAGGGGTGTVTSITAGTGLTGGTITITGTLAADTSFLFTQSDTLSLNLTSRFATKLNISDTLSMLSPYFRDADTTSLNLTSRFATKLNISDTLSMLSPYFRDADTTSLNLTSRFAAKQNTLTLTTTGSSGAATLVNSTLNIPQYSGGGGVTDGDKGDIDVTNSGATWTIDTSAISLSGNKVTGTLPVANGGTGSATQNFVDLTTTQSIAGAKTFTSAVTASGVTDGTESILTIKRTETGATAKPTLLDIYNFNSGFQVGGSAFIGYSAYNSEFFFKASARAGVDDINFYTKVGSTEFNRFKIKNDGETLIGYTADNGAYKLQVNGQIFATNATIATSDEKYKENITPLNKGLEIVNKLKPVTFNFISDTKNNFSEYEEVGFIAQDVDRALSTETFSKSIVKAADDSDPTSTMGLATQNLIPILVKAIQEQQALIKALEQRIINLENK